MIYDELVSPPAVCHDQSYGAPPLPGDQGDGLKTAPGKNRPKVRDQVP